MADQSGQGSGPDTAPVDPAEFRQLVEQMERANNTLEILVNRTNTLVRLLDLLNQRVDRLEGRG